MYRELLPYLVCPSCRSALLPRDVCGDTAIYSATLVCTTCAAHYPIRHGIADFLGSPRPQSIAQLTNELPQTAWGYERFWRPLALTLLSGERFSLERELALILSMAGAPRQGLLIDIACSNGLYARALARAVRGTSAVVAGIDHSLPMLYEAQQRALAGGVRVSYLRAEAQALPFATHAAAGVTIGGSLNEIGDLRACLSEVRRVMLRNAQFASMSLLAAGMPGAFLQAMLSPGGVRFFPPELLLDLFERAGLRVSATRQYGIVLFVACRVYGEVQTY